MRKKSSLEMVSKYNINKLFYQKIDLTKTTFQQNLLAIFDEKTKAKENNCQSPNILKIKSNRVQCSAVESFTLLYSFSKLAVFVFEVFRKKKNCEEKA